jgi:hypothetical protein
MYHVLDAEELKRQHQAYSETKMVVVSADINGQEIETHTPVSMSIGNDAQPSIYKPCVFTLISFITYVDPKELRRQRDRERYAQNRDEILKRQRLSREKRKATTAILNDHTTVSHTPATGQSGVTQLQKLTCAGTTVLP